MIAGVLHADVVEIVWLTVSAAGLALALDALQIARADLHYVCDVRGADGAQTTAHELELEIGLAGGDVSAAWWAVGMEIAFLLVGIGAALQATPPGTSRSIVGWVLVLLLVGGAATMPLRLLGQRRRRRRLIGDDVAASK